VNLVPYLTGQETKVPHEALFWRYGAQAAVRKGDWKLIRHEAPQAESRPAARAGRAARAGGGGDAAGSAGLDGIGPAGTVLLYNLAKDIHEDSNLAAENPDKVRELSSALDAWESQLAKPLWGGGAPAQNAPASQPAGARRGQGRGGRGQRAR
jgi:hypothetical protein